MVVESVLFPLDCLPSQLEPLLEPLKHYYLLSVNKEYVSKIDLFSSTYRISTTYQYIYITEILLLEKWQSVTFQEFIGYLLESFPCKIAVMTQYFH